MYPYRHRLPPLDALLVFEAVVRRGGFTKAAAELNVTQAAVSKRIRGLEEYLDVRLFARAGRGVYPTDVGRALYGKVASALDFLDEACKSARGRLVDDSISVAGDTAASHYWLGAVLQAFGRDHPETALRVVTSDLTQDLMSEDIDIAVIYGRGERPGWRLIPLFGQDMIPVGSPEYLATIDSVLQDDKATLESAVLLHHVRKEPDWIDWHVWLAETGMGQIDLRPAPTYNSYALAIGAALDGQGIALATLPLLSDLLNSGVLQPATKARMQGATSYFLGRRSDRALTKNAQLLYDWLLEGAKQKQLDSVR